MTDAKQCQRCNTITTEIRGFIRYPRDSEIVKLLWAYSDRVKIDLCEDCQGLLRTTVREWWFGAK